MRNKVVIGLVLALSMVVSTRRASCSETPNLLSEGVAATVVSAYESVLWSFGVTSDDSALPVAALIPDKFGNLYGTTESGGENCAITGVCGTVFEVSPPTRSQKHWTESVLWNFGAGTDGNSPVAALLMDRFGNLYGTTNDGGANCSPGANFCGGTVFELSPPKAKQTTWTENILWSFGSGQDGAKPGAGLIADKLGNLYGTTEAGGEYEAGIVFELTPPTGPQTSWTETILWNFNGDDGQNPGSTLLADHEGNLYGTTQFGGYYGDGTAFKLVAPTGYQTSWTEDLLWSFGGSSDDGQQPLGALIADQVGKLLRNNDSGWNHCSSQRNRVFQFPRLRRVRHCI